MGDYSTMKITALKEDYELKKSVGSLTHVVTVDFPGILCLMSLAKAHKFALEVVIATRCEGLAEDKSSSMFGIKQ